MTAPKSSAAKKPAAKRKTPVRKPTKAQQDLLSREELLALLEKTEPKDTRETREHILEETPSPEQPAEQFDKTNPLSPDFEVEVPQATQQPVAPTYYVRNLRNVPVSYRLTRQKLGEARTNLKPRGSRGDIVKVEDGDLKDPALAEQVQYQLVEIITEAEALGAVTKQAINQQTAPHPSMQYLRNELGDEYANDAVSVQPEAGQAAIGVGQVLTDSRRTQNPIVRPGTENGATQFQQPVSAIDEQARDAAIRAGTQAKAEGIEAGLGGLTVAPIAPVQRTQS